MIPEFFVLVSFFYHFGCVANLIIKRAKVIIYNGQLMRKVMFISVNGQIKLGSLRLPSAKKRPH